MQRCEGIQQDSFQTAAHLSPQALYLWVPEEVPAPTGTPWKKVTPGALQWEHPQEAEYLWTGVDALQISLLSKTFQPFLQCLNAPHTSLLSHHA